jgi:hypothetical protein
MNSQVSLRLEAITAGERVIARGDETTPGRCGEDRRTVSYVRGEVTEQYRLSEKGLEQVFVIDSLEGPRGAITVTETVETVFDAPPSGTTAKKLSFLRKGDEAFFISEAVASDASGKRLELPLTFEEGKLSFTLPAPWVKEATFPVTIDPLVGSPLTINGAVGNQGFSAAYNSSSNEWLVLYSLWGGSHAGWDLYGQRISSAGALSGSQITVATNAKDDNFASVAYAPAPVNRYLISWLLGTSTYPVLEGRIMNADGTFFTSQFQIANPQFGARSGSVAYDGSNWCVVYPSGEAGTFIARARFISPTGTLGTLVNIDNNDGVPAVYPTVTFGNGTYAAVWLKNVYNDTFSHFNVVARSFQPNGTLVSSVVTLDPSQGILTSACVSAGGGKFFASWTNSTSTQGAIMGTALSFDVGPFATPGYLSAFSTTTNEWLLVFKAPDPSNPQNSEIWGEHVTLTGTFSSLSRVTYNLDNYETPVALSWNSATNAMLVVYRTTNANTPPLVAQQVSMNAPVAPAVPTGFVGAVQSTSSIAWSWGNVANESGYDVHDDSHLSKGITWPDVLSFTETGLSENAATSRHVHSFSDAVYSGPSSSAAVYTKVHDPTASDYYLSIISSTQIDVVVTAPPNGSSGSTGVKIERQNGSKWTLLQDFAANYLFHDTGRSANTSYTYRITFQNGNAVATAVSPTQSITTSAPATPTGFAGAIQSPTSILWSWTDDANESSYTVYDNLGNVKGTTGRNVTTFTETGLAENTGATRYVKATNGAGTSAASASVTKNTWIHDPLASDFSVTLVTSTQITVTVSQPPNPTTPSTGCEISRSTDNANWNIVQAFSHVYTYSDSAIPAGTTYYYRFRYENLDAVTTAYSPSQSRTAGVIAVITTASKITKNPNTNISGYAPADSTVNVYFSGTLDGTATNTNGTWSYNATTKADGTYTVTAQATEGGVTSGNSNTITVTILTVPPSPPSNPRVRIYNGASDVLWDPSPSTNVAGYQVSRKIGTNGTWTILNTSQVILGTQYRDSGLTNGQLYVYRVTAVDNARSD